MVMIMLNDDAMITWASNHTTPPAPPPPPPHPHPQVPEGVEYVDDYGAITPVPDHDGTACFKWDDTLWAKADHFKVGGGWGGLGLGRLGVGGIGI